MKVSELYKAGKDLKLKGNVIVPFRKSEYHVCRIGTFHVIPDMTIDITEPENHDTISVEDFVNVINEAIRYSGIPGGAKHASVEIYYHGKESIYDLSSVYVMNDNLYLIIG